MKALRPLILMGVGGLIYVLIELVWRGYSHWTMFLVGGVCFVLIGAINEIFPWDMLLVLQMAAGTMIITAVEFLTGCIVNLWLGWNVWDYSGMPFNLYGQICLPFMGLWFLLSAVAIVLDDCLRYWWFEEEKPRYKLFWNREVQLWT